MDSHHRRSIRMPGYDYREEGGYFVTLCVAKRRHAFGRVENGIARLHPYGRIVVEEWERTAILRPEVTLSDFVVMPNHFHAIVLIRSVGAHGNAPGIGPIETSQKASSTRRGAWQCAPTGAPVLVYIDFGL